MTTRIISITAFMFLISFTAFTQSGINIWQSQTITNLRNGEENDYVCTFKIYPDDSIEWIQGSEQYITSYQILSTDGALPEQGTGQVLYHIAKEGNNGTITIERTETNEVILTLDMSSISSVSAYYKFSVISQ